MTSKSKRLVVVLVAIGVIASAVFVSVEPREPSFQGKELGLWLRDLDNWDGESNAPVIAAVQTIGTNSIPFLLTQISARDSRLSRFLCTKPYFVQFASIIHVRLQPNEAATRRQRAVGAFFVLGPKGEPAIPALTRLAHQPETASSAALALAEIGLRTMPILAEAATNSDSRVRSSAVCAFGVFRSNGIPAIPLLNNALKDPDFYVRSCAAWSLGLVGPGPDKGAVPPLISAMGDPHANVRAKATEALAEFQDPSDIVVSALRKALDDPDKGVRRCATNGLQQLTTKPVAP